MDTKANLLKRVPTFAECSKSELLFLASQMDELSLDAGTTLIVEGALNSTFFILLDGEVEITVPGRPPGLQGPGTFFGEISMMDRGPAIGTVVTTAPSRVLVLSHAQFSNAIRGNDNLALKILEVMAKRLRATTIV